MHSHHCSLHAIVVTVIRLLSVVKSHPLGFRLGFLGVKLHQELRWWSQNLSMHIDSRFMNGFHRIMTRVTTHVICLVSCTRSVNEFEFVWLQA